jgi:hypothetical protein
MQSAGASGNFRSLGFRHEWESEEKDSARRENEFAHRSRLPSAKRVTQGCGMGKE